MRFAGWGGAYFFAGRAELCRSRMQSGLREGGRNAESRGEHDYAAGRGYGAIAD